MDTAGAIQQAIDAIMKNEGGWSNRAADKGGPTMRGVTLETFQKYHPGGTVDDLRNLSDADARDIYLKHYICEPHIDQLPPEIIPQVADISVNSGQKRAGQLLQQALVHDDHVVTVDGAIGPGTVAAAQAAVAAMGVLFNNTIADTRQAFYNHIVAADPEQQEFLHGWTIRCNTFRVTAAAS